MEIVDMRVLKGPNYWSRYRKKLIQIKLDLGIGEYFPTNKIEGFADALEKLMPSLVSHRCSWGEEGGFFKRVRSGTWLGHVMEHIALELQTLADMDCGFGRTRSAGEEGVYHVVYDYEIENAGIYAGKAALRIVNSLSANTPYDLTEDIKALRRINNREGLGPSTTAIVKEALNRNIPYTRLDNNSMIMLGQGCNQKIIDATIACSTSGVAIDIASDKELTRRILSRMYVPFPNGVLIEEESELYNAIEEVGFPIVVKPVYGNHGRGVTTRIRDYTSALKAFKKAYQISDEVIIEKYISGSDFRFLLINYKLVAVAQRTPAMITGNGNSTIEELIDEANLDTRRGYDHENFLTRIEIDEDTLSILERNNLTLNSVLPAGEKLFLKDTANLSSGGTSMDVTEQVHPDNIWLAERIARLIGLDICGLDFIAEDISKPIKENNGALLEVNAAPGFRMHLSPVEGSSRNVAAPVLDMLFPDNAPSRIPVVAVTGTNGKTTVTRLIAHLAKAAGYKTGFTTTDGIYINGVPVHYGDCSGPYSAGVVLGDPAVDFAVLECARGGILRSGLGFDKCNISIVTNVTGDHLGLKDINTLDDLARVKAVVPQSTFDDGCAILNADDDLVYNMRKGLDCNIALFSMDPESERIKDHCEKGGTVCVIEKGSFILYKERKRTEIAKIDEVPVTFSGTSECMIQNVLPAILASALCNIPNRQICLALKTFIPSPHLTPGRMNLFRFNNFDLMIDYAHNEAAFIEMKKYLSTVKASRKVAVMSVAGDRLEEDIRKLGFHAAQMFDEIIIKHDRESRGRTNEQLTSLILQGIHEFRNDLPVNVISDELTAVAHAIREAKDESFIVVFGDDVQGLISFVESYEENKTEEQTVKQLTVSS